MPKSNRLKFLRSGKRVREVFEDEDELKQSDGYQVRVCRSVFFCRVLSYYFLQEPPFCVWVPVSGDMQRFESRTLTEKQKMMLVDGGHNVSAPK